MSNSKLDSVFQQEVDRKATLRIKEEEIKSARVESEYTKLKQSQEEVEKLKGVDFAAVSAAEILKLQQENRDYFKYAKKNMNFMPNQAFKNVIPFFPRNIIVIGAKSGQGKSTTTANLCLGILRSGKKCLVITNEEHPADVYNRITCLIKGWKYTNHDAFTAEQEATFDKNIPILAQQIRIIHDNYEGVVGATTTLEGIKTICEKLKAANEKFDAIIIDYFQNISASKDRPNMKSFEVQEQVATYLNSFRMEYPAPITIMSQLKGGGNDDEDFDLKLQGRKTLFNIASCVIEMQADKEKLLTTWIIRKHRHSSTINNKIYTGWENGYYCDYTLDFMERVSKMRTDQLVAKSLSTQNKETGE